VLLLEIRKVSKELILGHAPSKVLQNVIDGNPSTLETWLSASDTRDDRDVIFKTHTVTI
jgi:hypothetical protein